MAKVLWTQKQDIGPKPRAGHAMVFDAARQRIVLFGGDSLGGTLFGDTWEWDGENWTQVQDIGPGPRAFHALAHDSARGRSVLFGGRNSAGQLGDTWEWDGENWTQVADSGPEKRSGHAMAFDSNRGRVVLFGGESVGRLNDTWEWDGNEWVQQADSGPSPRVNPAMAYDTTRNRLVLFGGATQDVGLGDTWEWNGTTWTEEANFGPDPCAGAAMAFKGNRVALFGGIASIITPAVAPLPQVFSRSWEWDGQHWTARQDMGPGPRVFHASAFDSSRSRIVLFGGSPVPPSVATAADSVRGDTWEQFEEGAASVGVTVASVSAEPNPVQAGGTVVVTVTLASPASAPANIAILFDGMEIGTVAIAAGTASGQLEVPIPPDQATVTVMVTAQSGSSVASTTLSIDPAVAVDIASVDAVPNPAQPGDTVVITVTLTGPAPAPANVSLLADGQPFTNVLIAAGETTGTVALPLQPNQPPITVTLTAQSGTSQASTTLTIQ